MTAERGSEGERCGPDERLDVLEIFFPTRNLTAFFKLSNNILRDAF
jgi:hypothetical protein